MDVPVKCKLVEGRLIAIGYFWEDETYFCCVHGMDLRCDCDWCDERIEVPEKEDE